MPLIKLAFLAAAALALTACAVAPSGPSAMALPGSSKSYDQFRNDDWHCREQAHAQTNGAHQATNQAAATSAAVGTVVGAAAGAAIGGGQGAAVGAGAGLIVGSSTGADTTYRGNTGTQRQYDAVYLQCMYAFGHRIPVPASMAPAYASPPRSSALPPPPPPPGVPPPPPPR